MSIDAAPWVEGSSEWVGQTGPEAQRAGLPAQAHTRGLRDWMVAGRMLSHLGLTPRPLEAEALMTQASRKTGLSDWGPEGPTPIREALETLTSALEADARLHPAGRSVLRRELIVQLGRKLEIEHAWSRRPETREVGIGRPIVIAGMPESGASLLHQLLSLDSSARTLHPGTTHAPANSDPLSIDQDSGLRPDRRARLLHDLSPELSASSLRESDGQEPIGPLLAPTCRYNAFGFVARIPAYIDWLSRQDMIAPYQFLKRSLQVLGGGCAPGRWVLEAPGHTGNLESLLRAIPGAHVILLHRDPRAVVASAAKRCAAARQALSHHVNPLEIGPEIAAAVASDFHRGLKVLTRQGTARILPIAHDALNADPEATVRRIQRHFGLGHDPGLDRRIQAHLAAHPQHDTGRVHATLDEFGLEPADVDRAFATYRAWAETQ